MPSDKAPPEIARYETAGGVKIYKLPVLAFPPRHFTNCYLVYAHELTLIDTGSGSAESNQSLMDCFEGLRTDHGEKVSLGDVKRVIVTHGHIDHFGGLNFVREQTEAKVGIHVLDKSTVTSFRERLIVSSKNLHHFLDRAGFDKDRADEFTEMNKWSKNVFKSTPVDFTFDEGDRIGDVFEVFHTPGHCPGQVCLRLGDVLFTADHVLSRITPNQSPESIVRYNGLGHYYESLRKIRRLEGIHLGLGGHEDEMPDVRGRIDDIIAFHDRRLDRALEICDEPKAIGQIATEMFPRAADYHVLLAMTEAGAHVEYLYERGSLRVANVEEIEHESNPTLLYVRS